MQMAFMEYSGHKRIHVSSLFLAMQALPRAGFKSGLIPKWFFYVLTVLVRQTENGRILLHFEFRGLSSYCAVFKNHSETTVANSEHEAAKTKALDSGESFDVSCSLASVKVLLIPPGFSRVQRSHLGMRSRNILL